MVKFGCGAGVAGAWRGREAGVVAQRTQQLEVLKKMADYFTNAPAAQRCAKIDR